MKHRKLRVKKINLLPGNDGRKLAASESANHGLLVCAAKSKKRNLDSVTAAKVSEDIIILPTDSG
jgi:hypothetical protein